MARHDAATRALISARTRAAMASREVRAKISERTREGMARAALIAPEMHALRRAWAEASPAARRGFLQETIASLCSGSGVRCDG